MGRFTWIVNRVILGVCTRVWDPLPIPSSSGPSTKKSLTIDGQTYFFRASFGVECGAACVNRPWWLRIGIRWRIWRRDHTERVIRSIEAVIDYFEWLYNTFPGSNQTWIQSELASHPKNVSQSSQKFGHHKNSWENYSDHVFCFFSTFWIRIWKNFTLKKIR